MPFDSCSFEIGEQTLLEIDRQAKFLKTPLTSKQIKPKEEVEDEIVEESPNAKENITFHNHLSLHERLKNASNNARQKRKFEKSRSSPALCETSKQRDKTPLVTSRINDLSRLCDVEDIDMSAWERSAANFISPAVQAANFKSPAVQAAKAKENLDYESLRFDCSAEESVFKDQEAVCPKVEEESFLKESEDVFSQSDLDKAISDDTHPNAVDDFDCSAYDLDDVSFMAPGHGNDDSKRLIEGELKEQRSLINKSEAFHESVRAINVTIQVNPHDHSLTIDTNKDLRFISNWNLPQSVVNEYRKKNVSEMFEWQCECLKNPKVLFEGANLVYSAPTSAGKTLVSEILMVKNIVERKKKSLFILPFVSVVREKMFYLQDLMASSGFRVEGFFGGYHPPGGFESIDLAVCTIEKANSIVNRLLEQDKLSEIGTIVIDEVHLISDSSRGYILELLLTKILYMCEKFHHKIQLITMSATLPNVDLLQKWLKAEYYHTDFRPVELREMIKIGEKIYDSSMKMIRKVDEKWKTFFPEDSDEVCELAMETILENCQLIVFCPTKDWCVQLSTNLAKGIHRMLKTKPDVIEGIIDKTRVESLLEHVKALPSGVDQDLQKVLMYGCAFHHAGLTTDERDAIEMGFKDGTLKALVATSTLSSGVNLPARRVIIRTPMFGNKMMSNLTYRQMIGRAGRKGKDILGESILVCNDKTAKIGRQLVESSLDPISSCLDVDNHAHLKRALLEIIASGVAKTKTDLEAFVNSTLFYNQHNISFKYFQLTDEEVNSLSEKKSKDKETADSEVDPVLSSMNFLLEFEFIRLHVDGETSEAQFVPTRLGLACLSSSVPPKDGFLLFSELQKARQNFVLESELHAIYLVTPFSVAYQLQNVDWGYYADIHDKLPEAMRRVGTMVGVSETYMLKAIRGKEESDWRAKQIHKRFYTALALQELVNEKSISEVSAKYKIPRGMLQNLQQMSSTFAGTVTTFCKSLQWNLLALILAQFRERLFFGIHPDLIDLMKIPSMSSTRIARSLYKSGIEKLTDLANCKTLSVENVLMDLGTNFLVVGKSTNMNVPEVAKLLITDARNHIQNEVGLREMRWSQANVDNEDVPEIAAEVSTVDAVDLELTSKAEANENREGNRERKRKANTSLKAHSIDKPDPIDVSIKRPKVDLDNSFEYRKKLRSSGGPQDLIDINTQFMIDLDKRAENTSRSSQTSDPNESLFKVAEESSMDESDSLLEQTQQHLKIVDVLADERIFAMFVKEISQHREVGMSIGVKSFEMKSLTIGGNLLTPSVSQRIPEHNFAFNDTFYIDCISFCYISNRVCYLNMQNPDQRVVKKIRQFLIALMGRNDLSLNIYEARASLKVLQKALGSFDMHHVKFHDLRVGSWLMNPDTNLNWHQMVQKFSPTHLDLLELATTHSTVSSLGLYHVSRVDPKIRTAVECFLSNTLAVQQLDELKSTGKGFLARVYADLEMPIQVVLMKMELAGFPVNETKLRQMIEDSIVLQRQLENHIYELHGRKFNLSSSKEVSKVVGIHGEKKKVSTAKNVLDKIELPIARFISIWRTLAKTISNLQPLTKIVKNGRVFSNSFSLTQTGRISMHEPNLQNVTKDFSVDFPDQKGNLISKTISFRRAFECRKGKILLAADFCQLELRILTHLSKDSSLLKIMNSPGEDIFKKIAAKWNRITEANVTKVQREQTKQLCYGIIYGMGNKALAETMKVDENTAATIAEEFRSAYPILKHYGEKIVQKTREQGFIETVTCRRRYLPAIRSENSSERSQAERQALNTCIQGSASDLVKNAILRMDRNLRKNKLENCELVLHLHDELFYEVPEAKVKEAAKILIHSMQNCVKLSVPLLVKLKSGACWGELKDLQN